MKEVRTRVAPSPTGFPHVGTIYQALFDWVFARKHRGKFILRIEDTDVKRFVPGAEEVIYEALEWVGLVPDEGPKCGGDFGPYRQSERLPIYKKYAQELLRKGFAYYCFCKPERLAEMRKSQQTSGLPPKYDRHCLKLSKKEIRQRLGRGEKVAVRMKIPEVEEVIVHDLIRGDVKFKTDILDDQVLLKSDGFPTYHLAVVVDDHLMKISHTVRGEEWLSSAPKHVLLYKMFEWEPPKFVHLPILRNPDRSKISKRQGHTSVSWYREQGFLPEALLNFLALTVWNHPGEKEIFSLEEMQKHFEFEDVSIAAPIVDLQKLEWMNGVYIRKLKVSELNEKLKLQNLPRGAALRGEKLAKVDQKYLNQIIPLIQERMKKLSEFEDLADFFFTEEVKVDPEILVQKGKTSEETKKALSVIGYRLSVIGSMDWKHEKLESLIRQFANSLINWSTKDLFMTLRVALTGKTTTPPLFETMEVLGREKTLARLKKAELFLGK